MPIICLGVIRTCTALKGVACPAVDILARGGRGPAAEAGGGEAVAGDAVAVSNVGGGYGLADCRVLAMVVLLLRLRLRLLIIIFAHSLSCG